jgi:hypothetical protein
MGDNRPKITRLASVWGIFFYNIKDLEKTDVWRGKRRGSSIGVSRDKIKESDQ